MNQKSAFKEYLLDFAEYIHWIAIGTLILQLLVFILSFLTKTSLIILTAFLGLLALVQFTILKEFTNNDSIKRKAFMCFKFSVVLFSMGIINDLLWLIIGNIDFKALSLLPILADAAILIALFAVYNEPEKKVQSILENFYHSDFESFRKNQNKTIVAVEGCAIIGKDINTHKDVILPLKDRYLHTLILGPTGSGKTSQSIIPMIWRDIQCKGDKELGLIVLEPKGDLAEKVYAMCRLLGRDGQYFNPMLKDCPYFNPLLGDETDVIENFVTTFNAFTADSSSFFRNGNEVLLRRAITVCYRLAQNDFETGKSKKEYPTLLDLDTVLNNAAGKGAQMVRRFAKLPFNDPRTKKEQEDIAAWFMDDYYVVTQGRVSKTYENTSDARTILTKIISNKYLRDVLCPPDVITPEVERRGFIDFRKCLAERGVITISSAEGDLRDLGKFLGYFLILSLQSAVFSRPGNENTRPGCMLYIDEFQTYANTQFADMLTKGRSYRVACHIATQNRALIGMNSGKNAKSFTELVDTNCRNLILYPGGNPDDAKYYSAKFGEEEYIDRQVSVSRQKFNPLYGWMMRAPSTTEREVVSKKTRITPSEIIYQQNKTIIYSIIQNNTLQPPGFSKIEYIPDEINNKLDELIAEYNQEQLIKTSHKTSSSLFDLEKDEEYKKRNLVPLDDEEDYYDDDDDIIIRDEMDDFNEVDDIIYQDDISDNDIETGDKQLESDIDINYYQNLYKSQKEGSKSHNNDEDIEEDDF